MKKGIHPTSISDGFGVALKVALEVLNDMATPILITDRDYLIQCVVTSLASKILAQNSQTIAPIAVDAVLRIMDEDNSDNVDLSNIKLVKKLGGTIDDVGKNFFF